MTPQERQQLISRYADGFAEVERALAGFPPESLSDHPIPGKWSAREIVQHLADSETTSAQRLRKLLVEDKPVITGYDQELWATRLQVQRSRDGACARRLPRRARHHTAAPRAHGRLRLGARGWHTESGRYTPEAWLTIYAAHAHGHAGQIRRLRAALGK